MRTKLFNKRTKLINMRTIESSFEESFLEMHSICCVWCMKCCWAHSQIWQNCAQARSADPKANLPNGQASMALAQPAWHMSKLGGTDKGATLLKIRAPLVGYKGYKTNDFFVCYIWYILWSWRLDFLFHVFDKQYYKIPELIHDIWIRHLP